jgi:Family of unknown function (DUF6519)
MHGDFTRNTFKPEKHFSGVRLQQGRVQLDSDWNEQLDIQAHLNRTTERDVIGLCGVPEDGGGFTITPTSPTPNDLLISPGRIYVDGILVEWRPTPVPFVLGASDQNSTQVQVAVWSPDYRDFAAGQSLEAFDLAAPTSPLAFTITAADPVSRSLTLTPGGFGDKVKAFALPRLRRKTFYSTQPYYSDPNAPANAMYLAYLDVWERLLTPLEEPVIREVALGGPDTATRTQVVWQVKLLSIPPVTTAPRVPVPVAGAPGTVPPVTTPVGVPPTVVTPVAATPGPIAPVTISPGVVAPGPVSPVTLPAGVVTPVTTTVPVGPGAAAPPTAAPAPPSCLSVLNSDGWKNLVAGNKAWLSAQAVPTSNGDGPCIVPPKAGYRRLENQLYRVEIHAPGVAGKATWKWSRENGSVVTSWKVAQSSGNDLVVGSLGRDQVLSFASGQWVELTDDMRELQGMPGILVKLTDAKVGPQGPMLTIDPTTASSSIDFTQFTRNPKVRRWDQIDPKQVNLPGGDITVQEGAWINLEGGVQVRFQPNGAYATGDYWLVPARTISGNVEWPADDSRQPLPQPPEGIKHHHCHLALLQYTDGSWSALDDCREAFPPLASPAIRVVHTSWSNDDTFPSDLFQKQGLQITLDASPASASLNPSTMIVTLENPNPGLGASTPFILNGAISLSGNVLTWMPQGSEKLTTVQQPIRLRVTLKGHAIWGTFGSQTYFLDGQAFGQPGLRTDKTTPRIDLDLPSGNGARASDFESWFWLVSPGQVSIASVGLNPTAVITQGASTGTVVLTAPALTGGTSVALASGNTAVAQVPASVVVPAGQTTVTFPITAGTTPGNVAITATLGASSQVANLSVVGLQSVSLNPPTVNPGGSSVGTVALSGAAPAGVTVALAGNPPTIVQLSPVSLPVPAGSTSASFKVSVAAGIASTQVRITAALGGVTQVTTLTVTVLG